jgi:tetratricopeptide (TPR) repeat protein
MIASIILVATASASAPSDEKFSLRSSDFSGPCVVKVDGKPTGDPPPGCQAAIAAAAIAKEKAILYFEWAYSLNGAGLALQALPSLDKALVLAPNFRNARHERCYTLNSLGFYARALEDCDRDVESAPESADAYTERAFARHHLADFQGSLADRLKAIELNDSSRDAEIGVVREMMWLGRYDEAAARLDALPPNDSDQELRADLNRRRLFKPDGKERERCDFADSVDDSAIALKKVDDCTWAFDHEKDPAKRANFLTVRSANAIVAFQNRDLDIPDLQIAAALDPNNPQRHINLGFAYLGASHSWAAQNEFNDALTVQNLARRDKALALAGRGQARSNLGDAAAAFSDAKASLEIEPLEANVWLLGDLAFAKGDKEAAKKFWMAAYHLGARDDSLIRRLKSVGIDNPDKVPR